MPSYSYTRHRNPYNGVAVSAVTSLVVDTRDCFDLTVSWRSTSGTTSVHTYQISNDNGFDAAVAEASWSNWTTFGNLAMPSLGPVVTFDPPLGYRWARVLRQASGASVTIDVAKAYR